MSIFNSANPRIRNAQQTVLDTLASIPDEYGAVFVIDDYQDMKWGELPVAVREGRKREATLVAAERLVELGKRRARKAEVRARVVDMQGRRVA